MPLEQGQDGGLYRRRPRNVRERFADAYFRLVPNFMVGWPTWFKNRRAEGLSGSWHTLRTELSERIKRGR